MNTIIRNKFKTSNLVFTLVLALLVGALVTGVALAGSSLIPARATLAATLPTDTCSYDEPTNTRTCEFWAVAGTIDLPGSPGVPIWGYADTDPALGGTAQLPGPDIIANQGETIEVILHNNLVESTSLNFPGQAILPDLAGVAPGGTTTYNFVASSPGTYLYEAGLLPGAQYQVAMGLYGALIVRPSVVNQAYDNPATAFADEALLVLGDIDPALNNSADPTTFDMRDYAPKFFLINGQAYPDTDEIPSAAGNKVLLRYVNAGVEQHSMGTLGVDQQVLAFDGSPLTYSFRVAAATIGSGQTTDRMVTVPASAGTVGSSRFAVYDTSMLLHNNGAAGFGGILTFITVSDGTPPATGPTTNAVALAPNPTDGSVDVTLSARISGAANITAAEYFIGTSGADGTGIAMSAADGAFDSPIEDVTATITIVDLASLPNGDHTVYVHGSDGTWGAFNFATLSLDKVGPATSGITLAPNPSNGNVDVTVSATGDDSASGNSNIVAAEYFITDTIPTVGPISLTVSPIAPTASLDGTIDAATMSGLAEGAHTVSVHSQDAFLQWGAYDTATLAVDKTGPTTNNVVADPNPNNGSTPYNPTVFAVRVDATISDGLSGTPGVNSTILRAEGFINTIGADGSGFLLTPADGLFDETVEDAYVYIPLSTIGTLGVGTHQIYVHAQDASGNWGATDFVDLVIETDIPMVTNVAVTPNTTDGTVLVDLTATASDPSSDIVMAEWFAGADPGDGNGIPMTVSFNGVEWDLTATIDANGWAAGDYTISVRARDAAGNWSPMDSTILTVTTAPPTGPEQLYFSTVGNAAVPGVPGPNDDADVYLWDGVHAAFSRILDGADVGLPGNADIDALAFDGGVFYLSFNRNGGTNVPSPGGGVFVAQDEDVVLYDPENGEWELFFAGVDVCDGMDASNGHDIDAFDVVNGILYFSTVGNASVSGAGGPYDDADIYRAGGGAGCSRVFDASAAGLPGNADIDGLTVVDADTFYVSFLEDTDIPGFAIVQDEDVVQYDAGAWLLHFDGTAQGLGAANNQNLDAIDIQ
jgi:FtsP/CotA-like multicopper oxidase with cupredoxin domain